LIYGLYFFKISFTYNTAIESYERVNYEGLKNEGRRAKMGSPLRRNNSDIQVIMLALFVSNFFKKSFPIGFSG